MHPLRAATPANSICRDQRAYQQNADAICSRCQIAAGLWPRSSGRAVRPDDRMSVAVITITMPPFPAAVRMIVKSLMDAVEGAYRVRTAASTYIIDLDRNVIRRAPRTGDDEGALLRRDDELITLLEVKECTVGRPLELLVDLHVAGVAFTVRRSTPVVSIERVASPGLEVER